MTASARKNAEGEWIIPQIYFAFYPSNTKVSRKTLLEKIEANGLLQDAMHIEPRIKALVEQAACERCVPGYRANNRFYEHYKPRIMQLVGWECQRKELSSREYYDVVYETIYELLPGDEWDLYPGGIMPNGMYCPTWQEKYGREYP